MVALSNARKKASARSSNKLQEEVVLPPEASRESRFMKTGSAWFKSQLDIYEAMTKQMATSEGPLLTDPHPLADVSWSLGSPSNNNHEHTLKLNQNQPTNQTN